MPAGALECSLVLLGTEVAEIIRSPRSFLQHCLPALPGVLCLPALPSLKGGSKKLFKKDGSATLHSASHHSAPLHSVHGYAQVHSSIYIYIHIQNKHMYASKEQTQQHSLVNFEI